MATPSDVLYQCVLALMPAKAEPLLPVARCRRRGFRERPWGPGLVRCRQGRGSAISTAIAVKTRIDQREDQQIEHRHLHVEGFDFFAEIFRRAADHQAGDEDGENDEDEHAVEPGARHRRR